MSISFYPKLAASNIKKNAKTYLPYTISCVLTIAVYYIMGSLASNEDMKKMVGGDIVNYCMELGSNIVAIFSAIFLFYANSFLMKRREKEFGLFNILGMEKKHLAKVVALETLYIGIVSLAVGLIFGISLDKLMYLLILKLMNLSITYGFYISTQSIINSLILFGVIFFLIFLNSVRRVYSAKPIELLKSSNLGEREPKAKWLIAIIGAICLGVGYWMALEVRDPIEALSFFFVAVILVIAGTYLLFTAGSIALLKLLRKNKRYYYKSKHFISVSGMIYRMKQNAVGLANICILSTMVLVMISSTSSMMIGMQDMIDARYPYDLTLYSRESEETRTNQVIDIMRDEIKNHSLEIRQEFKYNYLQFAGARKGNTFIFNTSTMDYDRLVELCFVTLDEYNEVMHQNKTLNDNEILAFSNRDKIDFDTLHIFDRSYQVKEYLDEFIGNGVMASNIVSGQYIVVKDMDEIDYLYRQQIAAYGDNASEIKYSYSADVSGTKDEKTQLYYDIIDRLTTEEYKFYIENKSEAEGSFVTLYGGIFFLGVFLGFLFIMAMILIIYYKQISEGYDDRERFVIMQKVGMSHNEVKKSIHSQIITVFFMPLIMAGIHVCVAFPMMEKILGLMNMVNTNLYILCTVGCFAGFALLYGIIYLMTARTYYRIVKK